MEVYKKIKFDIICGLIGMIIFGLAKDYFDVGKDDSDSADARSGLSVRVDYKTGCQYLESIKGILVARVDGEGRQLCQR